MFSRGIIAAMTSKTNVTLKMPMLYPDNAVFGLRRCSEHSCLESTLSNVVVARIPSRNIDYASRCRCMTILSRTTLLQAFIPGTRRSNNNASDCFSFCVVLGRPVGRCLVKGPELQRDYIK